MGCGIRSLATVGILVVLVMLVTSLVMAEMSASVGPVGWSPRMPWSSVTEGLRGGTCGCSGAADMEK